MTLSRLLSPLLVLFAMLLSTLSVTPVQASSDSLLSALGIEANAQPKFLKVDDAFALESEQQGNQLLLTLRIADNYYLYRHSLRFKGENLTFNEPVLPAGAEHEDDFFGKTWVYYREVQIPVTLTEAGQQASLTVSYQGCTDGLCYPPTDKQIAVQPVVANDTDPAATDDMTRAPASSQQDQLAAALGSQGFWLSIAAFFALGLGLAFTPCVFPMYPILTGIIAGAGHRLSTRRAFLLSFVYVQGMAVTYTLLGLVVASAGLKFQAALQHPYVLIGLSVMFVLLALSMFGLYTLQLPSSLQTRLSGLSNRQQGGSVLGVSIMGMISGLVCSPCTTAPLSGALIYVAQSGDLWLGGAALYALSLGMGPPLLLLGTSGGKLLPRAGAWMDVIKQLFGFALLAVPILLLSRLWSDQVATLAWLGWGLLLCGYLYHHNQHRAHSVGKSLGGFVLLLAMMSLVVVGKDLLLPVPGVKASAETQAPQFIRIKTLDDLKTQLAAARGKPVLLDLYADWCVACKEFEHKTFSDPAVRARFDDIALLQADVTANDDADVELLNGLNVLGLPTLIFFDSAGQELSDQRVTGFMGPTEFLGQLDKLR
ncbi:TPA: protein-disulfide reductase DsbD [Aeromonas salmonicida]|uniref:Thiol:disulfide interchange protein DsbD n=2 Tax=Aeromonas salmonicida subsp. salmonicida TaxID=29491 RepID=A4SRE7_AERS4|nr:protein-disulfide reductase DsbD [Aeromonas salmonicida]ABO91469.1 thiol:disulfide interchange protein DsbD [Aeromonas salmonicida subsp. salmonicida A449]AYO64473.1 protein-disulfide reductase DsbD [Aeromonas salmonicida subsp. salmonicida 01-B526]EHI51106.1 thiol:disulfide interchange protein DsbD [Aeromonas salmonicida subsp. salmonicida 01-B526]EKP0240654.1 protein-disulfide reductase DsbD [Aeromonas salmonicida]EKP0244881.1 protein-disulfide reductase DsbD [Aeromonas salmonicida]